jgi:hypothetical protein
MHGGNLERMQAQNRRISRLLIWGSIAGLVVAYPITIYAKSAGWFPPGDRFSWWRIATVPAVCFAYLYGCLWFAMMREERKAKLRDESMTTSP